MPEIGASAPAGDLQSICKPCSSDAHCDSSTATPASTSGSHIPAELSVTAITQSGSGNVLLWSGSARLHDLAQFTSPADESLLWGNFSQRESLGDVGPGVAVCFQGEDVAGEGVCIPAEVIIPLKLTSVRRRLLA